MSIQIHRPQKTWLPHCLGGVPQKTTWEERAHQVIDFIRSNWDVLLHRGASIAAVLFCPSGYCLSALLGATIGIYIRAFMNPSERSGAALHSEQILALVAMQVLTIMATSCSGIDLPLLDWYAPRVCGFISGLNGIFIDFQE